jgi:hypothetical protein
MRMWVASYRGAIRPSLLLLLLLLSLVTGCAASSDYMRPTLTPPDAAPPPGAASVVFVRPSGFASSVVMTILDDHGRFLGDSTASSCFAVAMAPGPHVLIGWAENTAALQAELAPNRVYYVEVSPRLGWWSSRVQLLAITPHSEQWSKLTEWLNDCEHFTPDEGGGQLYLNRRHEDVAERIRRAQELIRGYDSDELGERTLLPADGGPPRGSVVPPPSH